MSSARRRGASTRQGVATVACAAAAVAEVVAVYGGGVRESQGPACAQRAVA